MRLGTRNFGLFRFTQLYAFEPQTVDVKGKGEMTTYLLVGRQTEAVAAAAV